MAAALRALLLDGDRRARMSEAGRRRVEAEFTLSGMMTRYATLYLETAGAKGIRMAAVPASNAGWPETEPR
jgi:glycosyltransferase involved in cell wall biosynthesis